MAAVPVATLLASGLVSPLDAKQLQQLHSVALAALQPLKASTARPGADDDAAIMHAKQLAKEHGALATGLLKGMASLLAPGMDRRAAGMLCELACCALEAMDAMRAALRVKGLELEAQRFTYVRRMLAAGQPSHALQQAWKLQELLESLPPNSSEATELQLSCSMTIIACVSEMLGAAPLEESRQHLDRAVQLAESLVQGFRCVWGLGWGVRVVVHVCDCVCVQLFLLTVSPSHHSFILTRHRSLACSAMSSFVPLQHHSTIQSGMR